MDLPVFFAFGDLDEGVSEFTFLLGRLNVIDAPI